MGGMFEHITANEAAGYCVGALLLSATLSALKIDHFIAASQRSSVGMCKRCGDLRLIACSKCKETGFINGGGSFGYNQSTELSISCKKCQVTKQLGIRCERRNR